EDEDVDMDEAARKAGEDVDEEEDVESPTEKESEASSDEGADEVVEKPEPARPRPSKRPRARATTTRRRAPQVARQKAIGGRRTAQEPATSPRTPLRKSTSSIESSDGEDGIDSAEGITRTSDPPEEAAGVAEHVEPSPHGVRRVLQTIGFAKSVHQHLARSSWIVRHMDGSSFRFKPWVYSSADMAQLRTVFAACNYMCLQVLQTPPFWTLEDLYSTCLGPRKSEKPPGSIHRHHPSVQIMPLERYLGATRGALQGMLAGNHIVVRGLPLAYEDKQWGCEVIRTLGNMSADRQIHDHSTNGRTRGTLNDVYRAGSQPFGKQLSLDTPGPPVGEGFYPFKLQTDAQAYQGVKEERHLREPAFPHESAYWHLAETQYCSHPARIDASGLATSISVQTGLKLFVLLVPGGELPSFAESNGSLRFPDFGADLSNQIGMIPVPVLLEPGDTL
ncbi:hypothetical protein V5O48_019161, partial [Marasmius crinis-equi]